MLVSEQSATVNPAVPGPIRRPATDAAAQPRRAGHRFPIGLRPTLLTAIVGLVLLSSVAISACAGLLIFKGTKAIIRLAEHAAVIIATDEAQNFFNVGPKITTDLAAAAQRGLISLDDPHILAGQLAERIRVNPQLSWIGYGDAVSGRYVGATRWEDGEIVEYVADPAINGSMPQQIAVAEDGSESPPKFVETKPYFVTTRPWFKAGITKPGLYWTPFEKMVTGGYGITCTTPFTAKGSTGSGPTGLFHVDMRLDRIAEFLSDIQIGERGAVFLIDREGHRVVSPHGEHVAAAGLAVDSVAPNHATTSVDKPLLVTTPQGSYEIVFSPISVTGDIGLTLAVVVDRSDITAGIRRETLFAASIGFGFTLLAIVLGILLSARISRPVTAITGDLAKVGAFNISHEPSPTSFVREINELGVSVDRMKASLRSFGHYVPTDLVRSLLARGIDAELGVEPRCVSIHFSDVENFTTIAEGMQPTALVEAMGRYFELMTGALTRHGGTVDKFMGDGIMAFFNAPEELPGHEHQACLSALEAQQLLAETAKNAPPEQPTFRARIGLGVGEVLVGNIGTQERFAYTLLGDEVNLTSRLEGLNKLYGTWIMATQTLMERAGDGFEWRLLDRVAVKGRHQGTVVCELMGFKGGIAPSILEARTAYESALEAYFSGDFAQAGKLFAQASELRPDDRAAKSMYERCQTLAANPPREWDGIHVMHEK
jgi:adenylate cyclase